MPKAPVSSSAPSPARKRSSIRRARSRRARDWATWRAPRARGGGPRRGTVAGCASPRRRVTRGRWGGWSAGSACWPASRAISPPPVTICAARASASKRRGGGRRGGGGRGGAGGGGAPPRGGPAPRRGGGGGGARGGGGAEREGGG